MPELPEIETIKRGLVQNIQGEKIAAVYIYFNKVICSSDVDGFKECIEGSDVESINRRGKYLLINFSSDNTLIISLRMTGQLVFFKNGKEQVADHTHLIFEFEDESQLRFRDVRKFGTFHLVKTIDLDNVPKLKKLGQEPFDTEFTVQKLRKMLIGRRKKIKQLLTDQTFIAGIGNIYADEILFRAGIHPEKNSNILSEEEVHYLYAAIAAVLTEAICQRGTSFRDYVDANGEQGNFQNLLQVYGCKGEICSRCGSEIKNIKLGGRTAHYCPGCQK